MSYCYEKGIPHSEFLKWDPEDRAKSLAWQLEAGERCSLCGTAQWEWDENPNAYDAEEHLCIGCYRKQVHTESLGTTHPGVKVELRRSTPQAQAEKFVRAKEMAARRRRDREREAAAQKDE